MSTSTSKVLGLWAVLEWEGRVSPPARLCRAQRSHQNSHGKVQHLQQRARGREFLNSVCLMAVLCENFAGTLFREEGTGFMASSV